MQVVNNQAMAQGMLKETYQNYQIYRQSGASMAPIIEEGDIIVVRIPSTAVPYPLIKAGMIHVFRCSGHVKCHRILWTTKRCFQAKGDATSEIDPVCLLSQWIGAVIRIHKANGLNISLDSRTAQLFAICRRLNLIALANMPVRFHMINRILARLEIAAHHAACQLATWLRVCQRITQGSVQK